LGQQIVQHRRELDFVGQHVVHEERNHEIRHVGDRERQRPVQGVEAEVEARTHVDGATDDETVVARVDSVVVVHLDQQLWDANLADLVLRAGVSGEERGQRRHEIDAHRQLRVEIVELRHERRQEAG
jgi:hypothetical protein